MSRVESLNSDLCDYGIYMIWLCGDAVVAPTIGIPTRMRQVLQSDCPARQRLDDGISEILGLPDLGNLRRLLASEPVVSNERLRTGQP